MQYVEYIPMQLFYKRQTVNKRRQNEREGERWMMKNKITYVKGPAMCQELCSLPISLTRFYPCD